MPSLAVGPAGTALRFAGLRPRSRARCPVPSGVAMHSTRRRARRGDGIISAGFRSREASTRDQQSERHSPGFKATIAGAVEPLPKSRRANAPARRSVLRSGRGTLSRQPRLCADVRSAARRPCPRPCRGVDVGGRPFPGVGDCRGVGPTPDPALPPPLSMAPRRLAAVKTVTRASWDPSRIVMRSTIE